MIRRDAFDRSKLQRYKSDHMEEVVRDYAELMQHGAVFPPAVVFYDGSDYWLGDGLFRILAQQLNGETEVPVEIRSGTSDDAGLHFVRANSTHGLPYSQADREYQRFMQQKGGDPDGLESWRHRPPPAGRTALFRRPGTD